MHTTFVEIPESLVPALRMSEALPNIEESGSGAICLLYDTAQRPIGYLVRKSTMEDAWESNDPRTFVTESHAEALSLLAAPFAELPERQLAAT